MLTFMDTAENTMSSCMDVMCPNVIISNSLMRGLYLFYSLSRYNYTYDNTAGRLVVYVIIKKHVSLSRFLTCFHLKVASSKFNVVKNQQVVL